MYHCLTYISERICGREHESFRTGWRIREFLREHVESECDKQHTQRCWKCLKEVDLEIGMMTYMKLATSRSCDCLRKNKEEKYEKVI